MGRKAIIQTKIQGSINIIDARNHPAVRETKIILLIPMELCSFTAQYFLLSMLFSPPNLSKVFSYVCQ